MMAWIRLEDNFYSHPKFRRLARILDIDTATARGYVATLWSWAINFAFDGDLTRFHVSEIEESIGWDEKDREGELVRAMIAAGFVDQDGDQYVIHEWDDRPNSHKDRLARYRRGKHRNKGREPVADNPEHVADNPVNNATEESRQAETSGAKPSQEEKAGKGRAKSPRPRTLPTQTDIIEQWNAGAAGFVDRAHPGGWSKRDQWIKDLRSRYSPADDPQNWGWMAKAMAADDHQGKAWKAKGRLRWLVKPANVAHFERWLDAGLDLRQRHEARAAWEKRQPDPGEIGSAPAAVSAPSDAHFEMVGQMAKKIKEQLRGRG